MGRYLNLGNAGFRAMRKGLYVDKTGLISFVNETLGTKDKLTCVSRPRRFGKSFSTQMLCAYYDKSCDSQELFADLAIASSPEYGEHLNRYDVIYLDITWFISTVGDVRQTVKYLQREVSAELCQEFPAVKETSSLPRAVVEASEASGRRFIVIIDEWDALFREAREDISLQEEYIRLLRGLFKSSQTDRCIEAAYMTGILPIKKYGTQSALTDFREYTMIRPGRLAEYMGFTEQEVRLLCERFVMDFEKMKSWYDGYRFPQMMSVYSPNSVIEAIRNREYGAYWTETETYESLKSYINMNMDGLRDAILFMLGGGRRKIITRRFQNDMTSMKSADDVMTLLVHLGYLGFDAARSEVFLPNREVADEFQNAVEDGGWETIARVLTRSEELLAATLEGRSDVVAQQMDEVHRINFSALAYNDENSLSCAVGIAYFCARKDYVVIREFPTGKGFADMVFLPKKYSDKPALVVELKWNRSSHGAIAQIKERMYPAVLEEYGGAVILVGINYDKKTKRHDCVIEKMKK